MKLLHVIQSVNPKHGGPIEGIRQQARQHKQEGTFVEITSLDSVDDNFLAFPNTPVYPTRLTLLDNIFPVSLMKWLKLNHSSYDAIIINGIWGFHLLASWLALRKSSTPYYIFSHGMLDPWFKNTYPLKHLKKWLIWPWAIYPVIRDAEALFFTCEREKLLARESFWLYDCQEVVIDYGTEGIPDPEQAFSPEFLEQHPQLDGKQIFLFLGRVHPKKGPDLLIKSISLLQKEGHWNPAKMQVVMAGPADSKYARQLVNIAKKLNISDSIYWTGMITGNQKWGAFQAADVFILPSHQENFGISVAEALSCRLPVLISTKINIYAEIEKDQAGLVELDNLHGTANLIRRWLALDQSQKSALKRAARDCFEKRFHISKTTDAINRNVLIGLISTKLIHDLPH
jgi:glycosyltransferase involved in cell wall biosynthesis